MSRFLPKNPVGLPAGIRSFAQKVTCWFLNIADSHSPIANVAAWPFPTFCAINRSLQICKHGKIGM
ncbi:MAG: hypothetical protein DMG12_04990 [Acidobacteria bacterium]|nr:MAG: hypothetical protein DMG12_04990 [Acidobacteriota bacterium]